MNRMKKLLSFLLTAALSIAVWEFAQSFCYQQIIVRGLSFCQRVFVANQTTLNEALPSLIVLTDTQSDPQSLGSNLYAFVRGASPDDCTIIVPVRSVGDFYRFTYDFALVWTADINRLAAENPAISLVALEDGWWAVASVKPQ